MSADDLRKRNLKPDLAAAGLPGRHLDKNQLKRSCM